MSELTLADLKAKDLKVIATNAGLEFDKMASAETMIELLEANGITEIPEVTPEADDEDEVKEPVAKPKRGTEKGLVEDITAGEFTVITSINRNNQEYAPGNTIVFDEVTDEVRSLVADKVISK